MKALALALLAIAGIAYALELTDPQAAYGNLANTTIQGARTQAGAWLQPVVTPEEVAALDWVRANTRERTVFATDIFGGELIMGQTLREGIEGGDWAIIPNVIERMNDAQYKLYGAKTSGEAHETARKYGAAYVWAPNRQIFAGYEWKPVNRGLFDDQRYFEKVYDNGTAIYRVK